MNDEVLRAVNDWLANAREDMETALLAEAADPPKLRAAVFHAQQTAEKALKAYLTLHGELFDWTHKLPALLELCVGIDAEFQSWREAAEILTPYATRFRYPGPPGTPQVPDKDHVREAIEHASEILNFVLARIPPDAQ